MVLGPLFSYTALLHQSCRRRGDHPPSKQDMEAAPDSVQASLPDKRCLRKQLIERRRRARGYPLTQETRAKDLPAPLPRSPDGTEGLYLLDDVTISADKRVLAITCSATLSILNQMHKVIYLDGTFKIAPLQFEQVWVVRAHILGSDTVESLIYFLLEDRTKKSYYSAMDIIKRSCPNFAPESVMLDFEIAERSAI